MYFSRNIPSRGRGRPWDSSDVPPISVGLFLVSTNKIYTSVVVLRSEIEEWKSILHRITLVPLRQNNLR